MKSLSTKKILLICFALIFAVVTGVFATLTYRNSYAMENPDSIVAYADDQEEGDGNTEGDENGDGDENGEGDEGNEDPEDPDDDHIAKPLPPEGDNDFDTELKELVVQVGKLRILVTGWKLPAAADSTAIFNTNPDGNYSDELLTKIDYLMVTLISYSYWDVDGNQLTGGISDVNKLPSGSTFFIHIDLDESYAEYIQLDFAEGVSRSLAVSLGFQNETLEEVPKIEQTVFELEYTGESIDVMAKILCALLKDRDYLTIVGSESDEFVITAAGEYQYTICFKSNAKYCWAGTKNDRSPVVIIVKVAPFALHTDVDFGEYHYTGNEIDISALIEEYFFGYVEVAYGYSSKQTAAGVHELKLNIKDQLVGSVAWDNGESISMTFTWTILKSVIRGEKDTAGEYGIITITSEYYEGGVEKAVRYIYTDNETGEVVTKLEKGHSYHVVVELINESLEWSDDSVTEWDFVLLHDLTEFEKPRLERDSYEFSGKAITFNIFVSILEGNGDLSGTFDITDPRLAEYIEIVENLSDSLTQTDTGRYKVVIRFINGAAWVNDAGVRFVDDLTLWFTITATQLDVTWQEKSGVPRFSSNYSSGDYSSIVKCVYTDTNGNVVEYRNLVVGNTYTATLTLLDTVNFKWKEGVELSFTFTLDIEIKHVNVPTFSNSVADYTGEDIELLPDGWADIAANVTIVSGSFRQTNAGTYEVVVSVNEGCAWLGNGSDSVLVEGNTVKFIFTIRKAVLQGEWNESGRIKFTSSYVKDYNDVVEYEYRDASGNIVAYENLVKGASYTVTVKLKPGMEKNFDDSKITKTYTIKSFDPNAGNEKKGGLPWWVFLIIGLALLIIIIIILIIILIFKRRKKDDDYEDFYGDEYYGDGSEEGAEGDEDGGYYDYEGDGEDYDDGEGYDDYGDGEGEGYDDGSYDDGGEY